MAKVDLAVLNDHELDLNTTMMYRNEDYLDAIRLVNEGKVTLVSPGFQAFRLPGLPKGLPIHRRQPGNHHESDY